MMENNDSKAQDLWRKFLDLTQEMRKFLAQDDVDMFLELLRQRLELQKMIEQLDNHTYHLTAEGSALIAKIGPVNAEIQYKTQLWLNKTKKTQNMARAYDSLGYESAGFTLNREL